MSWSVLLCFLALHALAAMPQADRRRKTLALRALAAMPKADRKRKTGSVIQKGKIKLSKSRQNASGHCAAMQ